MYRNGHPASMLARHVSTIKKADGFTKHVAISKSTWGPILWIFFHGMGSLLATIVNPELRDSYTKRMWVLTKELLETVPCPYCRGHALDEYKAKKMIDDSKKEETRNAYQVYFFEFHNRVNTRLHKTNISYEEMLEKTQDINVAEKIQEYYRTINGYRIWKRRDEFMAKFNELYRNIQATKSREKEDDVSTAITLSTIVTPSMS
jgi:Zn-finger nucleic acid-binding protein